MHGSENVKFANAQKAKQTYQYKNIKQKLYKTNAAICYTMLEKTTNAKPHINKKKVGILLVLLTYVYRNARFRKRKES
jgi:hypothetical protein